MTGITNFSKIRRTQSRGWLVHPRLKSIRGSVGLPISPKTRFLHSLTVPFVRDFFVFLDIFYVFLAVCRFWSSSYLFLKRVVLWRSTGYWWWEVRPSFLLGPENEERRRSSKGVYLAPSLLLPQCLVGGMKDRSRELGGGDGAKWLYRDPSILEMTPPGVPDSVVVVNDDDPLTGPPYPLGRYRCRSCMLLSLPPWVMTP